MTAGRDPSDTPPRAWRVTAFANGEAIYVEVLPTLEEADELAATWSFATDQLSAWTVQVDAVP